MPIKKVFSASDAQPIALYAHRDKDGQLVYPILVTSSGSLVVSTGMTIPDHDQQVIDEADANNITITYKKDGATVATKTIAISGTTTTITVS